MMHAVVTGAAGFIGSHLCEHLLSQGDEVVGVDALTDFYDPRRKRSHIQRLLEWNHFSFSELELTATPLEEIFGKADVVYHLAGQPGVRPSWGSEFDVYLARNVAATQRVLEALRVVPVWKLVYASSSSVYGDAETYPTSETLRPQPVSPYGVTKLAGEHLCELYRREFGVPAVSLRLFTVYGPRQRPDMAFSRLVSAALQGTSFLLYGDGEQTRDFTYVADVVAAMRMAALSTWSGVANVGGGARTSMINAVRTVEELSQPVDLIRLPVQHGDVRHTGADITLARQAFGYDPQVTLREGLARMVAHELALAAPEPIAP
jgi:nucleoside-diphosphate-sugar epimerase